MHNKLALIALLLVSVAQAQPPAVVMPGGAPTRVAERRYGITREVLPGQVERGVDFSVRSSLGWIAETARVANCVVKRAELASDVTRVYRFDLAKRGDQAGPRGPAVAKRMVQFTPVIVTTYCKPPANGVQTNAYRNLGSNVVYVNTCVPRNPLAARVDTLVHERLHVAGFGHGDNSYIGKEWTVPYKVGSLARKYAESCK